MNFFDEIEVYCINYRNDNVVEFKIPFLILNGSSHFLNTFTIIEIVLNNEVLFAKEQYNTEKTLLNLKNLNLFVNFAFKQKSFLSQLNSPSGELVKNTDENKVILSEIKKCYNKYEIKVASKLPNEK